MESGRPGADSGVGGDPCVPNGKSPKLGLCSLAGGFPVRPLAIRCGVCAGQLPFDTPRVREHPAPSGALGQNVIVSGPKAHEQVREHPAPSGALRRKPRRRRSRASTGVREHPAPSGALRQLDALDPGGFDHEVREHPAPSGALRHVLPGRSTDDVEDRQGAPSAIRCIETAPRSSPACSKSRQRAPSTIRCIETRQTGASSARRGRGVREHPAPSGALRQGRPAAADATASRSGGTQHHQVH